MKPVSVRTIALVLTLSVLVTSAVIGGGLLYRSWAAQRELMQAQLVRLAQTLGESIDRELASGMGTLQALTLGLPQDAGAAQAALRERAMGLMESTRDLEAIALNAPDGEQLWNTRPRSGQASVPRVFEHEQRALATMQPLVTDLYRSRSTEKLIASYVVPVVLGGAPRALVGSLAIGKLVARLQPLATKEGAIAALVDRQGRIVARTGEAGWLGEPVSPAWTHALATRDAAGVAPVVTREGIDSYGAWARLPQSRWTLLVAVPAAPQGRALMSGLVWQSVAACLLAAGGTWVAWWLGRAMVLRARRLASDAQRMAQGGDLAPAATGITEFDTIQHGLVQASTLLREREAAARELERVRLELLERERAARQDAEQANRFKDESLGVLGHEMRSPLAAIVSAAHVLAARLPAGDAGGRLVRAIQRQARTLTRLVDDLMEVGRLIGGKVPLERRRIDLAEVVHDAVEVLRLSGATARHRLDLDLRPVFVSGDPDRLQQVATNLLTNALRYSPPASTVHVATCRREGVAELRVRDEGVGMDAEDLQRVFGLFVQVGPRGQDVGLGIGLSVVKRLVELHGGRVHAQSPGRGEGATLVVQLPASQEQAPADRLHLAYG